MRLFKAVGGLFLFVAGGGWALLSRELFKEFIHERFLKMLEGIFEETTLENIFRFGPTVILFVGGLYLFSETLKQIFVNKQTPLPVGTISFVEGVIELTHKIETGVVAGKMHVELKNNSDDLIYFDASMFGNINGKSPPGSSNILDASGLIYPRSTSRLVYSRVVEIDVRKFDNINPTVVGVLNYKMTYRRQANPSEINRMTSKEVIYNYFGPVKTGIAGRTDNPITVLLFKEIEA